MHVLLCTPDPAPAGGVARSARRLTAGLRSRGHPVTLLHPDGDRFPGELERSPRQVVFAPPPDAAAWAEHVHRHAHPADVVVGFYGVGAGPAAVAGGLWAERPVLLALRGNDLDRDYLERADVRWAVDRATAVCTVSREMARKVEAWSGRPATWVGNAVDPDHWRPEPEAGEAFRREHGLTGPVAGLFGELKRKRGVEALSQVVRAGYTPLVVGRVRAAVEALVPPRAVRVPRTSSDAVLRAAYAACDVVVQPSRRDGTPNVVLEAMACARVVVGRRVGGLPDVIRHGETGFLVDHDEALHDVLVDLRERPRPEVGEAARAAVPRPEEELERWLHVLRACVSS